MSQYNLPPVNTLSAALDSGSVPIAPELMGEQGLPPSQQNPEKRRGSDATYDPAASYPGFANSNARGEERAWDAQQGYADQSDGRDVHPWAHEEYRQTDYSAFEQPAEPPKPRKRSRVSKSRPSKDVENLDDLDNVEFEDPNQDPKAGPVFVHPPETAAQACVRCHRIKRKCDNARPRCAGCSKADVPCVFELSPATSTYVHNLKADNNALTSQIASTHERIAHLESIVSSLERDGADTDASRFYNDRSVPTDLSAFAKTVLSQTVPVALPTLQIGHGLVDAFLSRLGSQYPLFSRDALVTDVNDLYAADQGAKTRTDDQVARDAVALLVLAIAIVSEGARPDYTLARSLKERASAGLKLSIERRDLLSVKTLLLSAIYATYDTQDQSLVDIGLAVTIAFALDLHRQSGDDEKKNVFASLYNFDRAIAISLRRPLLIRDDDIDVELPGSKHRLQRLAGEVYTNAYSISGTQNTLPKDQREAIIASLQTRLTAWEAEPPNDLSYNRQYHLLLVLLLLPSPLHPEPTTQLQTLYESSAKNVEYYASWRGAESTVSIVDISDALYSAAGLLYALNDYDARGASTDASWKEGVNQRLRQCRKISETYGHHARPAVSQAIEHLTSRLVAKYGPVPTSQETQGLDALAGLSSEFEEKPISFTLPEVNGAVADNELQEIASKLWR